MAQETVPPDTATMPQKLSSSTGQRDIFMLFQTKSSAIDIEMNMPTLLIPQNSKSSAAFVIDLGLLEANNKLSTVVGVENKIGQSALLDTLTIQWSRISLSRLEFHVIKLAFCVKQGDSFTFCKLVNGC